MGQFKAVWLMTLAKSQQSSKEVFTLVKSAKSVAKSRKLSLFTKKDCGTA